MIGLLNANALNIPLADNSVQMVATSPPYYGLRDYKTGRWEGGDPECDHNPQRPDGGERANRSLPPGRGGMYKDICGKCGALRIDEQLGLEPTPEEYVSNLVAVFREVRRVLRDDGVVFLNLGDSYANNGVKDASKVGGFTGARIRNNSKGIMDSRPREIPEGLKPKDLIGIPWRVAFALQADGWWLRSDIIWSKPNPMPESVTDRPTKAHEYVFLLTKSQKYYWDQDAVREPYEPTGGTFKSGGTPIKNYRHNGNHLVEQGHLNPGGRNLRTVWTIATAPYKGAHFATWPPKLVEPMIKAGSSEKGCCPVCGKAWVRVVSNNKPGDDYKENPDKYRGMKDEDWLPLWTEYKATGKTTGWRPSCDHDAKPIPCVILDPFAGSGTTLMVARQLGRSAIGLDLSYTYLKENATKRLELDKLKAWVGV